MDFDKDLRGKQADTFTTKALLFPVIPATDDGIYAKFRPKTSCHAIDMNGKV